MSTPSNRRKGSLLQDLDTYKSRPTGELRRTRDANKGSTVFLAAARTKVESASPGVPSTLGVTDRLGMDAEAPEYASNRSKKLITGSVSGSLARDARLHQRLSKLKTHYVPPAPIYVNGRRRVLDDRQRRTKPRSKASKSMSSNLHGPESTTGSSPALGSTRSSFVGGKKALELAELAETMKAHKGGRGSRHARRAWDNIEAARARDDEAIRSALQQAHSTRERQAAVQRRRVGELSGRAAIERRLVPPVPATNTARATAGRRHLLRASTPSRLPHVSRSGKSRHSTATSFGSHASGSGRLDRSNWSPLQSHRAATVHEKGLKGAGEGREREKGKTGVATHSRRARQALAKIWREVALHEGASSLPSLPPLPFDVAEALQGADNDDKARSLGRLPQRDKRHSLLPTLTPKESTAVTMAVARLRFRQREYGVSKAEDDYLRGDGSPALVGDAAGVSEEQHHLTPATGGDESGEKPTPQEPFTKSQLAIQDEPQRLRSLSHPNSRHPSPSLATTPQLSSASGSVSGLQTPTAGVPATQVWASDSSKPVTAHERPTVLTKGISINDGLGHDDDMLSSRSRGRLASSNSQTRSQAQLDLLSKLGASSTPRVRALERQLAQVSSVATGLATSQASSVGGSQAPSLPGPVATGFIPPVATVGGDDERTGVGSARASSSRRGSVVSSLASDDMSQIREFRVDDAGAVGNETGLDEQAAATTTAAAAADDDDTVHDGTAETGLDEQAATTTAAAAAADDDTVRDSTAETGLDEQAATAAATDAAAAADDDDDDDDQPISGVIDTERSFEPSVLSLSNLPSLHEHHRKQKRPLTPSSSSSSSTANQQADDELLAAALGTLPGPPATDDSGDVSWQTLLLGSGGSGASKQRAASSSAKRTHRKHKTAPPERDARPPRVSKRSGSNSATYFAGTTAGHVESAPGLFGAELLALQQTISLAKQSKGTETVATVHAERMGVLVGKEAKHTHAEEAEEEEEEGYSEFGSEGLSERHGGSRVAHTPDSLVGASGIIEQDSGVTMDLARQSTAFDKPHTDRRRHSSFSGVSQLDTRAMGESQRIGGGTSEARSTIGMRAAVERGGVQSASVSRAASPRPNDTGTMPAATDSSSVVDPVTSQRPTHRRATTKELSKSTLSVLTSAMAALQDDQFLALSSSDDDNDSDSRSE